jgi:hypothetical protein
MGCSLATNNAQPVHAVRRLLAGAHGQFYATEGPVRHEIAECFNMITAGGHVDEPAPLDCGRQRRRSRGVDCASPQAAVCELPGVMFKRGRKTVTRRPAVLHRPSGDSRRGRAAAASCRNDRGLHISRLRSFRHRYDAIFRGGRYR